MAAAGKQQQVGKVELHVDEAGAQRMTFEMVDRDQRLVRRDRQPLAHQQANHHPANQSGSRRCSNRIHFADRDVGFVQHLPDQPGQDFDMGAGRDLRHHAAERPVRVILSHDCLGEDLPIAADQRHCAVVAGGFEGQDQRHLSEPLPETPALR